MSLAPDEPLLLLKQQKPIVKSCRESVGVRWLICIYIIVRFNHQALREQLLDTKINAMHLQPHHK